MLIASFCIGTEFIQYLIGLKISSWQRMLYGILFAEQNQKERAILPMLRASHAKPWKDSDDVECGDPYNGLLLSPNLDTCLTKD